METEVAVPSKNESFMNAVVQSMNYLRSLESNKQQIMTYFDSFLDSVDMIDTESKSEIYAQRKWFLQFINGFTFDAEVITQTHMSTENSIFIQFKHFLKETKSNAFSFQLADLKHLPRIQSKNAMNAFDTIRFTTSISYLLLYLYYFFLNKHKTTYLTPEMFDTENSLINTVSVSHIDYIFLVYQSILLLIIRFCTSQNNDSTCQIIDCIDEQDCLDQSLKSSIADTFKVDIVDFTDEIDQFINFMDSIEEIASMDQVLMQVSQFEDLYGFLLAKQSTMDLIALNPEKKNQLNKCLTSVIEECVFSQSIPNIKMYGNRSMNCNYMHPYTSLISLIFNQFIASDESERRKLLSRRNSEEFYSNVYDILTRTLQKIFSANIMVPKSANKETKSTLIANKELAENRSKITQLNRCLDLIQDTIAIIPSAQLKLNKLAEDIFNNIRAAS